MFGAALATLVLLMSSAEGASAAPAHGIEIALPGSGSGFTAHPVGGVLHAANLEPGGTASGVLGVRNGSSAAAVLTVSTDRVVSSENGCMPAERAAPGGCAPGPGQLPGALILGLAIADRRDGAYTQRWSGPAEDLAGNVDVTRALARNGTVWIRLTASLPSSVGNEVQSDTFGFALRLTLEGSSIDVDGVDGSPRSGAPAATGVPVVEFVAAGLLLVAAGLLVLDGAGRRRRGRASGVDDR